MNNYGLIRTAAAVPQLKLADTAFNTEETCRLAALAYDKQVSLLIFPELSLTGSTCGDLITHDSLIKGAETGVRKILEFSRGRSMTIVAGAPVPYRSRLYNCAVVIRNGNIKGIVPKIHVNGAESRWFSSGRDFISKEVRNDGILLNNGKDCMRGGFCGEIRYAGQRCNISPNMLFGIGHCTFAIEIGNDFLSLTPPSAFHAMQGAQIMAHPSAEAETVMADKCRNASLAQISARNICGYIHCSAGIGESSQDQVHAGSASIWEAGAKLAENSRYAESSLTIADIDVEKLENSRRRSETFASYDPEGTSACEHYRLYNRINLGEASETDYVKKLYRHVEAHPFAPESEMEYRCREIFEIQTAGLQRRLSHIGCRTAVIGISGGLDSTLALLAAVMTTDRLGWSRDRIIAVTMPGFGTTSRTKNNAWELMEALGVTCREISIVPACEQHFMDIGHDKSQHDATYENSQARERTQLLMDIANQTGGIVIGTGDLSELALGWATYNGDHMSMYGVNAGIPKTLVRRLVEWAANNRFDICGKTERGVKEILMDIVDTPISPELIPAFENGEIKQVTEDLVGPYELHDFFIYNFMHYGYSAEKIAFLAKKAFQNPDNDNSIGTYSDETIEKWLNTFIRRFFNMQFKRSCMPDGPAVDRVSLSPRGGWNMPSDAYGTQFIKK